MNSSHCLYQLVLALHFLSFGHFLSRVVSVVAVGAPMRLVSACTSLLLFRLLLLPMPCSARLLEVVAPIAVASRVCDRFALLAEG